MHQFELAEITRLLRREIFVRMASNAAYPKNNPGMLDRAVGIIEFGTDAADVLLRRKGHHLAEPIRCDHLDVVVDEGKDLAPRFARAEIVDGGVVEGVRVGKMRTRGFSASFAR